MASFPNNLPPEGLALIYKLLIYYGILYVISTAISAKIITRKRVKPLIHQENSVLGAPEEHDEFIFDNNIDRAANLKIGISSVETAILELMKVKDVGLISDDAYSSLNSKYSQELERLTNLYETMDLQEPILEVLEDQAAEIEPEENLDEFLGLDDDDEFLKPKTREIPEEFPTPVEANKPVAPKPVSPKQFSAPKPVSPKQFSAPKPVSPKQFSAPKPVSPKQFSAPKPVAPSSLKPQSPKPITPKPMSPQAVTPTTGQEGDEKMFAKSTSIAAIRMDMLRELARLKKLINEDE